MAFTNTGVFTGGTTATPLTGIEQLLAEQQKKKKATTAATTQPANVFASTSARSVAPAEVAAAPAIPTEIMFTGPASNPAGGTPSTPTFSDPGHDTGETAEEKAAREAAEATATGSGDGGRPEPPPGIAPQPRYISDDPSSPLYWETLGYEDDSWVGLPYDEGYFVLDDEGNPTEEWVTWRDMRSIAEQLHDLQNIEVPERPELIDLVGSDAYGGIQDLIDLINDPNTAQADRDAAIAQFEREMGQEPGWYADQMGGMYGELSGGIMGQEGLNEEYRDAYGRETQLELQGMRSDYTRMIEAMSAQGRNVAGYMKMDEIVNSLATFEMQRDVQLMNTDLAMKQAEYDALNERWQTLYNMGQMSAKEYQDNIMENRTFALQGYAQQLATLVQQNQLTLQAYSADLEAVRTHAEIVYQGIMADMGVSEAMMNEMSQRYEMYLAPYYTELEAWSVEQEARNQRDANILSSIGIGGQILIGVGMILLSPLGTSAICIEMMRQGKFPMEWRDIDQQFGMLVRIHRPDVSAGYLRFCEWIIPLMRKSKVLTWLVNLFFQPWVRDMAYLMKRTKKKCSFGRFLNKFGFWLFSKTGKRG